jgi:peroxiredoxin
MRTTVFIFCLVCTVYAQRAPTDALKLLQATAQKYSDLSSYESSALADRTLEVALTFRVRLIAAYAGPKMTPESLPVPMIPLITNMQFLGVFDESGKSVGIRSLAGPTTSFSFDQITSRVASAKLLGAEPIDKHLCDIVEVQYEGTERNPSHGPVRYWIDRSTKTVWKMQFNEQDVLSKTGELVHWTVVWDSWSENQTPPSSLLEAAKTMMAAKENPALIGMHAPAINGHALDGSRFDLAKLRGTVVVLDFWATWCGPCAEEMAALERLKASLPGKAVEIWSVTEDDPATVRRWLAERKRTLPTVLIPRDTAFHSYAVDTLPQIAIIDRNGNLAHQWVGLKKEGDLREEIESLLSDSAR